MINRSKMRGMFLGIAIGDSLGMPAETFSQSRIDQEYGRITMYYRPDKHKWFDGREAGTTTDDFQLTAATAEALIESELDMESQVKWHIKALNETDSGWGNTTRFSVQNLSKGIHWANSGLNDKSNGVGNGVAMKISPVAALFAIMVNNKSLKFSDTLKKNFTFFSQLNDMTHPTKISLMSSFSIFSTISYCLNSDSLCIDFDELKDLMFINYDLLDKFKVNKSYPESKDDVCERISDLFKNINNYISIDFIKNYGEGSCYCYNSIPFSLGFFLKKPNSIEALFDVVSAGGDTDSNGAMVGAMLGALNGEEIFPSYLINGLKIKDQVIDIADRFCEKFVK